MLGCCQQKHEIESLEMLLLLSTLPYYMTTGTDPLSGQRVTFRYS